MQKLLKLLILIFTLCLLKMEARSQIQFKKFTIQNFTTIIRPYPLQVYDIANAGQRKIIYYQIVINQKLCVGFIWLDASSNVVLHKVYADPNGRDIYCTRLMPTGPNSSFSLALAGVRSASGFPDHPLVIKLDNTTGNILSCQELANVAPPFVEPNGSHYYLPTDIVQLGNKYKILASGWTPVCYDFDPATNIYSYTVYSDSDISRPLPIQLTNAHFVKSYHNSELLHTGDITFFGMLNEVGTLAPLQAFVYKEASNPLGTYYNLGLNNTHISAIHINGESAGNTYNIALQNSANQYVFESNSNLSTVNWTRYYNPPANTTLGLQPENNHGTKAGFAGSGGGPSVDYFPGWITHPFTGNGYFRVDLSNGNLLNANFYDLNKSNINLMRTYTDDPNQEFTTYANCLTASSVNQSFYYLVDNSLTPSTCPTSFNFTETTGSFTKESRTLLRNVSGTFESVPLQLTPVIANNITVQDLCFDIGGRLSDPGISKEGQIDDSKLEIMPYNRQLYIQSQKGIIAVNVFNNTGQLIYQGKNINSKMIKTNQLNHGSEKIVMVQLVFSDKTSVTKKVLL